MKHYAKVRSQLVQIPIPDIDAVKQNLPALYIVKSQEQVRDCRLARSGVAYKRDSLAWLNAERNILQNPIFVVVGKPHISEFDLASRASNLGRLVGRGDCYWFVKQLEDSGFIQTLYPKG